MTIKTMLVALIMMPAALLLAEKGVPVGLQNVGNSCFMNAALQGLHNMSELTTVLRTKQNYFIPHTPSAAYINFITNVSGAQAAVNPQELCDLGWAMMGAAPQTQQDAEEFLVSLLTGLTDRDIEDTYKIGVAPYAGSFQPKTALSRLFFSEINSIITAPSKNFIGAMKTEPAAALNLPILAGDISLQQSLDHYFDGEKVADYALPSGEIVVVDKKFSLEQTARYLILTLKRNEEVRDPVTQKVVIDASTGRMKMLRHDDHISIPLFGLDVKPFFAKPGNDKGPYELIGMIMHSGSATGGHYTAYVKVANQWYECNDSVITPVESAEMEKIVERGYGSSANVIPTTLFYERSSERPRAPLSAPLHVGAQAVAAHKLNSAKAKPSQPAAQPAQPLVQPVAVPNALPVVPVQQAPAVVPVVKPAVVAALRATPVIQTLVTPQAPVTMVAKKPAIRKPAVKKTLAKKFPVKRPVKKPVVKRAVVKAGVQTVQPVAVAQIPVQPVRKPVVKAAVRKAPVRGAAAKAKKPIARKPVRPVARKAPVKRPAPKKVVVRKPVATNTVARKAPVKRPVAQKPVARKPVVKKAPVRKVPVKRIVVPQAPQTVN